MFVVHVREHLRDGVEEHGRFAATLEAALAVINGMADCRNLTFRLFRLGDEIPLAATQEAVMQPAVVRVRYGVEGRS